jgi:hypothetical protein
LPAAERKKMRQKMRKAEARAKKEAEDRAKEEEAASVLASKGGKKGSQTPRPVDTDPHGDKLIMVEDPLGEAMKYLKLLQDHSADSLETHLLAFEVFFRKQKHLLALQVHYMISKGRNLSNFARRIGHGWLFPALTYSMLVKF